MVPAAPRYDPRILAAVRRLDTRAESLAEVCRRIGEAAWELELPRPSYVHLRRLLVEKRRRDDAARERRRAFLKLASDIERDLRARARRQRLRGRRARRR